MTAVDFNSICRLCIQQTDKNNFTSIFNNENYENNVTLPERIKYSSSVEVNEGDGLPLQICNSCLFKLNQSFAFQNQCVLADIMLKNFFKNNSFNMEEVRKIWDVDLENQIIKSDFKITFLNTDEKINSSELELGEICVVKNEVEEDSEKLNCVMPINFPVKEEVLLRTTNETEQPQNKIELCSSLHICTAELKKNKPVKRKSKIKNDGNFENKKTNFEEIVNQTEYLPLNHDMLGCSKTREEDNSMNITVEGGSKYPRKQIKKVVKPKPAGLKKGKTKKLSGAKEKPSSYTCDYCHKVYPSEGGWRYHIHTTHNENYQPFICDLCGESFKVKKNLEGHKNSVHFRLKLHLCDLCGRGFASKYALKVHKIWHNDEKNFPCEICGTKFRTRGKLNTHKSIHGGPKKFMCHICSRNFRWKKDFEIHMRTHTGEKPFKCSHCGKAFASLTNMKKHERNHSEKLEVDKSSEVIEMLSEKMSDHFYKSESLDLVYTTEDLRDINVNQI